MTSERVLESMTGVRIVIQEDTPELLSIELRYPPVQRPPTLNAHPTQEERFHVLTGRLRATVANTTRDYGPGERFTIPADTLHRVHNAFEEPAWAQVQVIPPRGMLPFYEAVMGLTSINLVGLARLRKRHKDAVRVAAPLAQILGFVGLFVRTVQFSD